MADDAEPKPPPRPRRRRSDTDPTVKPTRVRGGRRRTDLIPEVAAALDLTPAPDTAVEATPAIDHPGPVPAETPANRVEAGAPGPLLEPVAWTSIPVAPPRTDDDAADTSTTRFLIPGAVHAAARPAPTPDPGRSTDATWLPMLEDRSPDPGVCPFLRAVGEGTSLTAPIETPDTANRCAALREAVPQSLRQQELVCLATGHVNCPRYLRGAVVVAETPEPVVRPGSTLTPAVLGSLVVLVMAFSASIAFVMANGGMELAAAAPTRSAQPSATAVAVAPSPSGLLRTPPAGVATATPTRSPTPTPTPTPSPSPTPSPTPTPEPTPRPMPRPAPTSDRYALLRPCPDAPDCWIYRVRAGDNLFSIANYFGVSLDSIYARNPWVRNGLRPGQELRLPPPTR